MPAQLKDSCKIYPFLSVLASAVGRSLNSADAGIIRPDAM